MKHNPLKAWRIKPGQTVRLADLDPGDTAALPEKDTALERMAEDARAIDALQDTLYAERRRSLLVILQGIDTSGKDGTVKHVFGATGPLGVSVTAFGAPSGEELAHDFLWRIHAACPRRGTIGIFNRSHYEDVLVARVRKLAPADEIERRYDHINAFERNLVDGGTTVLKCMLHISKDEQRERLQARLDTPEKNWKFNPGDLEDRAVFGRFMEAYEIALERCSTEWAPWHVIPADHKWARNAAIASLVRRTLEDMDPAFPKPVWEPGDYSVV